MKKISQLLCFLTILLIPRFASAFVVGPYTADAGTVFLFHLDEPAGSYIATNDTSAITAGTNAYAYSTPSANSFSGPLVNEATNTTLLGAISANGFSYFTGGSFGNCANMDPLGVNAQTNGIGVDFNQSGGFNLNTNSFGNVGDAVITNTPLILGGGTLKTFTVEALVNLPHTNATLTREIVCSDSAGPNRAFQFRVQGNQINFNWIAGTPNVNILAPIPSSGPNAFVSNGWFHVAVTHIEVPVPGGTNTIIYWTALSDSSKVANPIFTNTTAGFNTNATVMVVIGNEGRAVSPSLGSAEGLIGLIDEVRISNTNRAANQLMFRNDVTVTLQPVSQVVSVGGTATFTVAATTDFPMLSYQWRSNGVPLANAGDFSGVTTPTLQIANVQSAYAANYDCLITNSRTPTPDATNSFAATLTIHTALNLLWRGTVNSTWDTTSAQNWLNTATSGPTNFFTGDNAAFDDSGTGNPVLIPGSIQPKSVTVNATHPYTFSGNGKISGTTGLTKTNSGTLTIQTTNDYSGVTYLGGGTVSVSQLANSLSASSIGAASGASSNLVFDGGTLQYTGPTTSSDHGATMNAGGGTIDVSAGGNTLALGGGIIGTGSLTKIGNDTLALGGANSYTGATTVSAGILQLTGSATFGGGNVTNNGALLFSGTIIVTNNISGSGNLTNDATGTVTLSGNNSYSGATIINGPVNGGLVIGSSGALGNTPQVTVVSTTGGALGGTRITLNAGVATPVGIGLSLPTASTTIRSTLFAAGASSWNGPITIVGDGAASPSDQLAFASSGGFLTIGGNIGETSFPGTLQLRGNGTGTGSAVTNVDGFGGLIAGTITLDPNATLQINDGVTWTINSSGNTWGISEIAKGTLQLGANNALPINTTVKLGAAGNGTLDLAGFNQQVGSLALIANAGTITNSSASSDSTLTFAGGFSTYGGFISDGVRKTVLDVASGTLILTNASTYAGDTLITAGTLALSGSGSISNSANINVSGGALVDVSTRSDTTLTVSAGQTLKGGGDVSGGSVVINGTISPGNSSIGTLTVDSGDLTLQPGSVTSIEINKTLNTSDQIIVNGNITYGGTLAVANLAGPLVAGDSFTLFSGTSLPGNFANVTGSAGTGLAFSFTNGVLTVVASSVATNPTNITFSVSGSTLTLAWPADHLGWILQSQTNALSAGLSGNWFDLPGSGSSTQAVFTISPSNPSVFYRLRSP